MRPSARCAAIGSSFRRCTSRDEGLTAKPRSRFRPRVRQLSKWPPRSSMLRGSSVPPRRSSVNKRWFVIPAISVLFAFVSSALAAKLETSQAVDSGSFGVYVSGKRIATETFSVNQGPGGSVAKSQMKAEDGGAQASELELGGAGELRHYEWHELSPGKAEATVAPNGEFLTEKLTPGPGEKPFEQPFLVGTTTSILDDFFFLHREIL